MICPFVFIGISAIKKTHSDILSHKRHWQARRRQNTKMRQSLLTHIMRNGRRLKNCQFSCVAYIIWFSEVQIIKFQFFTIKILSFGVVNLIYTANVIFQVTFPVYRMIKLSEAELASTVLSYTVKLFRSITETLCGHEGIFFAQKGAVEFNPPCHTGKGLLCKRNSFLCRSLPWKVCR